MTIGSASRSICLVIGLLLIGGLLNAQDSPPEFKTWTNLDGKEISAAAVGFNRDGRKVIWELPNGSTAESPLESLSPASRALLIFESGVSQYIGNNFGQYDPGKTPAASWLMLGVSLFLIFFLSYVMDFLYFRLAVRFLLESYRDLTAYLKLLLVSFVSSLVITPLNFYAKVADDALASFACFALSIVQLVVMLRIPVIHYQITYGRSFLLGLLHVFIRLGASLLIMGALALTVWICHEALNPLLTRPIDEFIYRPLDMLP